MRKLPALIGPALAALLLASACGDEGEPAATPAPTATAAPAEERTPTPGAPATGKIAFHSDRDGNFEIYVMNADGSNQTRLTDNAATDAFPAWGPAPTATAAPSPAPTPGAPAAGQIAFVSHRDGNVEIYVMNADGSGVTRLSDAPGENFLPAWSPAP